MTLDPETSLNHPSVLDAFRFALTAATRQWRFCAVWMLAHAALAVVAIVPAYVFLRRANGDSVLLERLVNPGIDTAWMIQAAHQPAAYTQFARYSVLAALGVGLALVAVNIFLTGGTIGLFRPEADGTFGAFLDDCRSNFLRLLGVAALSWVPYAVIAVVGLTMLSYAGTLDETAVSPEPANRLRLAAVTGMLAGFVVIHWFFDYVKVGVVHGRSSSVLSTVPHAARFLVRRGIGALGLFFLSALMWSLVTFGGSAVVVSVGRDGYALIGVGFVVQQIVMLLRAWVRFVFYAGEYRYFLGTRTA